VRDAVVRECRALPGTGVFLSFLGAKTGNILLSGNIHRDASAYYTQGKEVRRGAVVIVGAD
jgi:hypothetical protein